MRRAFFLLVMLVLLSCLTLGIDVITHDYGAVYINETTISNVTNLSIGLSEDFNVTLVVTQKGVYLLYAMGNSTFNTTYVYSNPISLTLFGATPIIPTCVNRLPSDPFCVNFTYSGNISNLSKDAYEDFTIDLFVAGDIPVPSNWTLFAVGNSSTNSTYVFSNSIRIEVTTEISVPLSVTINSPTNISYTNKTVLFNVLSKGDTLRDCWYNIGSGDVSYTCNTTFQLDFSEGSYYFIAYANQTNGSETSANVSFSVNTNPLLSLNKPDNNLYSNSNTLDFNWTVIDSTGTLNCDLYIDADINDTTVCLNSTLCNVQVIGIPDATYDWKVSCSDGTYSNMSETRNFTIDTLSPVITLVSPLNSSYNAGLTTSIYTDGVSSCFISIDGSSNVSMNTTNNINFTDSIAYADGSHRLVFSCNDTAQNWEFNNVSFFMDATYPVWTANVTNVPSGLNYNPLQNYAFNITYSDNLDLANISFYWAGSLFSTANYTSTLSAVVSKELIPLGANNYSYYWKGCDRLGNCNTSDTWVYEIRKAVTTSYAYIDSLRENKTYTYSPSEHTILANWTTNLTALLYLDGTSIANGTDMVFGAGLFNVTVINEGNNNYTGSNETWWVEVNKADTNILLFLNNSMTNLTQVYGEYLNISLYTDIKYISNRKHLTNEYTSNTSTGVCTFNTPTNPIWASTADPCGVGGVVRTGELRYNYTLSFVPIDYIDISFIRVLTCNAGDICNFTYDVSAWNYNLNDWINIYSYAYYGGVDTTTLNITLEKQRLGINGINNKVQLKHRFYQNSSQAGSSQVQWASGVWDYNISYNNSFDGSITPSLFINETLTTSPFIGTLASGNYNISGFNDGNSNYSSSYETYWLYIVKKNTSIIMTGDNVRGDITKTAEDVVNFTVTLIDSDGTLMTNNVGWYNNFSGAWVLHNTSVSPLYNATNLSGYSTGLYIFGGRFAGNTNYSASYENWTLEVTDFNLTLAYSCGFPNFTYSNPSPAWIYNSTINFTNGTGTNLPLIDFRIVRLEQVKITNATGGERLTFGNYSIVGRTIISRDNSAYLNKQVNVTARYYYTTIVNNTQKDIQPRWQNDSCGIYNLTLETEGTTLNGTLKARLSNPNNFSMQNITIKLGGNNSNYTQSFTLNNNTYVSLLNLTRGLSYMIWHFMDFNITPYSVSLNHTIDFHMFVEGS